MILPLHSVLVKPYLDVQLSVQQRHRPAGVYPEKSNKMIQGIEHHSYKKSIRELELFSLIAAFQYLKGGYKKEVDRLLSRLCCGRTRVNSFKPKEERFSLGSREKRKR